MGNYYSPFPLRVSEVTIGKMKYIGKKHHRSATKGWKWRWRNTLPLMSGTTGRLCSGKSSKPAMAAWMEGGSNRIPG